MSRRKNNNNYQDLCSGFQNLSLGQAQSSKSISPKFWCENLHPSSAKYKKIENLIDDEWIVIEKIVKITNPYLQQKYEAKKRDKKQRYGKVYESLLFHGTKKSNLESICLNNFNPKLAGTNVGHKFGKGISFSNSAKYASNYEDETDNKVMILARVLTVNVCQGNKNMNYPPPGFDASQNDKGTVLVKYDEHEFYPAYDEESEYSDDDDSEYSSDDDYEY